jgi:membrane protease YdiL (CAAX protease family)
MHSTGTRPAGWYPWGPDGIRWWDGAQWTPHVAYRDLAPPQRPPKPPHPRHPLPLAVGALGVILVSLVISRYALDALSHLHWPIAVYVVLAGLMGYGPVLLFCWWGSHQWGTGSFRGDSGLFFRAVDTGWGPVTWLCCLGAEIAVSVLVVVTHIPIISNTEGVDDLSADRGYVIALLVLAVVAAPIVEEIVFRGVVLRGLLTHMGPPAAIATQAIVFGMAHFDPVRGTGNIGLIMVLSGVGAVLGGASYLFRRIGPTIIAHAILNALAMAIALSGVASR